MQITKILAHEPGFGHIFMCPDCDNIHVQLGFVNLTLDADAFSRFAVLVNRAAAEMVTEDSLFPPIGNGEAAS